MKKIKKTFSCCIKTISTLTSIVALTATNAHAKEQAAIFSQVLSLPNAVETQVLINEVDADQSGTDRAEFVELFDGGQGKTDLSGLSVVLINGSNDTIYNVVSLNDFSTTASGYFVVCGNSQNVTNCNLSLGISSNAIQNGQDAVVLTSQDSMSLAPGGSLNTLTESDIVDAIVYDTNDGDDSVLLDFLTPGQPQINEGDNGNKDIHSNQRCPNGSGLGRETNTYDQFEPTPGTLNLCGTPELTQLYINEVDADNSGTDRAEFVELYDGGDGNALLDGLSMLLINGSNDSVYASVDLTGLSTDSQGYIVLCGNPAEVTECDFDFGPESNAIQNGQDAVAIVRASATKYPTGSDALLIEQADIIDALVYDTNDSDDSVLLELLTPGQAQINEDGNDDKDIHSNQRCPNGSGDLRDTSTFDQFEPTAGQPNTCGLVVAGDLLINEIDADQTSTDDAEFLELFDGGSGITSLDGYTVLLINGNGDAVYNAIDLDGFSTTANGYFVICGSSGNVANCDLPALSATNGIQNGADAAALVLGDASEFPNGTEVNTFLDRVVDAIVYGTSDSTDFGLLPLLNPDQPQVDENESGNKDIESSQRCDNGSGGLRNTDTYVTSEPTPGMANSCDNGGDLVIGSCDADATFIHMVQGNGTASPIIGEQVVIEGVVSASYQQNDGLGGFFIQEETLDMDNDPQTSEGVFVDNTSLMVSAGNIVRVLGTVVEDNGQTVVNSQDIALCPGTDSISTASLSMPVNDLLEFEQVEGMQVSFSQPLFVNEHFNLGRFGEVVLSSERKYQFTHNNPPSVAGYAAHLEALDRDQLTLDDGKSVQNPETVIYPTPGLSANNSLRLGSSVTLSGIMSEGFGSYRVQPTETLLFVDENPRPEAPSDLEGNFKVASFNVLNFFTRFDGRGADNQEEFDRQRDKLLAALIAIDADIVGLIELENNETESLVSLVSGLNDQLGAGTYAFVNTGTIGTDQIKNGLIYKPATVTPTGSFAILDSSVDPTFLDTRNRPVLAQTFTTASNETLTVAVNHFKSKGSNCNAQGDPDQNDGQGNCSGVRTAAAVALANWLETDPTQSGDEDFLILGDLNSYAMEDPITALKGAGYVDLVDAFIGSQGYSYVFSGELGYLDYIMANQPLSDKVSDVLEWHVNADEPRVLDYNTEFKSQAQIESFYAADEFRNSDHDPIIVAFTFSEPVQDTDNDGVYDDLDNCILLANPNQEDTNGDGFGNRCDPDLDNNGVVSFRDVGLMRRAFFTNNPDADLNSDGFVNFEDQSILGEFFFSPPGPSALVD